MVCRVILFRADMSGPLHTLIGVPKSTAALHRDHFIGQARHSASPLPRIHSCSSFEYPISSVKSVTACPYVQVDRLSMTERSVPQNERRGEKASMSRRTSG